MKIKEVIVVEGKNDTQTLKRYLDCDTIETGGTSLSDKTMEMLKVVQEKRGLIVFSDPDAPGEYIRRRINEEIKGVKHAFIEKKKARTSKKVGVEHASKEDILESLSHLMTYDENVEETITKEEFLDLGLSGQANSAYLREQLGNVLFIGKCNAKTLYKRLNMLRIDAEKVKELLKEYE